MIVGAARYDDPEILEGPAFLFLGGAGRIVGAPFFISGQPQEGVALLFLGSATGISNGSPTTADAVFEGNANSTFFGSSLAAGDGDGDGFDVSLVATHPDGRGKLKFEVEWCPK